jgi:hypothetical protein
MRQYNAPGLDFFAGMSEGGTHLLKLATAGREALQQVLSQAAAAVGVGVPEQWIEQMRPMMSPPDRAVFDTRLAGAIEQDWSMPAAHGRWLADAISAPGYGCCLTRATSRSSSDATRRSSTGSPTSYAVTADPRADRTQQEAAEGMLRMQVSLHWGS